MNNDIQKRIDTIETKLKEKGQELSLYILFDKDEKSGIIGIANFHNPMIHQKEYDNKTIPLENLDFKIQFNGGKDGGDTLEDALKKISLKYKLTETTLPKNEGYFFDK